MPFPIRRLTMATATTLALGAAVGAAPALASPDLLTESVRNIQPAVSQSITTGNDRVAAAQLDANAMSCTEAITLVAPIRATSREVTPKREWLTGLRLQIIADHQLADALRDDSAGDHAAGARDQNASQLTFFRSNRDIAEADHWFGASPKES